MSRTSSRGWPRSGCRIQDGPTPYRRTPPRGPPRTTRDDRRGAMASETTITRRGMLAIIGIFVNGLVAAALAVPIGRYLLSSVTRGRGSAYLAWVPLGPVAHFPEGETRLATFRNPYVMPTDGKTVDTACWVRRIAADQFQVFAVNCAHLG